MDELAEHPCIKVKRKNIHIVREHAAQIRKIFAVRLSEKCEQDVSKSHYVSVYFSVEEQNKDKTCMADVITKLQSYVDSACEEKGGDDSSYDSDHEAGDEAAVTHRDVSRTTSDTLGAESAEWVHHSAAESEGYTARVEFALKLGYTEKHVQAALAKLGPSPGQNELLQELIRLGACRPQIPPSSVATPLPEVVEPPEAPLRPIVIDGSNVAMSHGNKEVFSCRGIKICVDWFRARGHKDVTVFVPKWRKEAPRPDNPITDQEFLSELERDRCLVFTPSRLVGGKRMVCYDDRYILKLAAESDGIVVSNDNYRDLVQESPEFRKVVAERILMYSFVNDRFMPPDDPLGRSGPTLDNFLKAQPQKGDPPPPCPYGRKCTYGNKCKFHHPERGPLPHKSVTERLSEHAQRHLQARGREPSPGNHLKGKSLSLPLPGSISIEADMKPVTRGKIPLSRSKSNVLGEQQQQQQNMSKPNLQTLSLPLDNMTSALSTISLSSDGSAKSSLTNLHQHMEGPGLCVPATDVEKSKSRSVENVYPPGYNMWYPPNTRMPTEQENQAAPNMHRKLQRQLTLNPSCDPRLVRFMPPVNWDSSHTSVTRIASAPDSYRAWPVMHQQMHRLGSTSDPQLNRCEGPLLQDHFEGAIWTSPPPPPPPPQTSVMWPAIHQYTTPTDDARRRMHYHLSSIFPEERVQKAMQLYPDETNPQKICAAILSMFPEP